MAIKDFRSGEDQTFEFAGTEYPVKNTSLNIPGNLVNYSNARDGRFRVTAMQDSSGTFSMPLDLGMPNVTRGDTGNLLIEPDGNDLGTYKWTIPIMISDMAYTCDSEGEQSVSFSWVQHNGTITYPTYHS